MKLTKLLKEWLVENMQVDKDADDDTYRGSLGQAVSEDRLSSKKLAELTEDPDAGNANEFTKTIKSLDEKFDRLIDALTPSKGGDSSTSEPGKTDIDKNGNEASKNESKTSSKMAKAMAALGGVPDEIDGKDIDFRVKQAVERYNTDKKSLIYPDSNRQGKKHQLAGQLVTQFDGLPLQTSSDLDKALSGVWAKFQILSVTPKFAGNSQRAWEMLTDHEKELLCHLVENEQWDDSKNDRVRSVKGYVGPNGGTGLKSLIDDATSGGLEAAPIVFDEMVIQTPLLHSELFPLVSRKTLDRGRRVEGVSTATVTGSWGGVDATAISLFNTASYVSAFDTTIFRWEGSIRIGLDFISDTPIDFGAHITAQYGERFLEDADDVIAVGNGTTQPEGIMNATGLTTIAWGGSTSLGNYESLRFGVSKPEHGPAVKSSAVFCGTETSYERARAIPVGASDARRLGGMDYDSYSWMERPFKINESLANTQVFYAILARYRMYIRRGLAIRTTTEGDVLVRNNELLIVAMTRLGGQLERGAAASVTTTAPA